MSGLACQAVSLLYFYILYVHTTTMIVAVIPLVVFRQNPAIE